MTNETIDDIVRFLKTAQISLENAITTAKVNNEPVAAANFDQIWEQIEIEVEAIRDWQKLPKKGE